MGRRMNGSERFILGGLTQMWVPIGTMNRVTSLPLLPRREERAGVRRAISCFMESLHLRMHARPHPGPLPSDGRGRRPRLSAFRFPLFLRRFAEFYARTGQQLVLTVDHDTLARLK